MAIWKDRCPEGIPTDSCSLQHIWYHILLLIHSLNSHSHSLNVLHLSLTSLPRLISNDSFIICNDQCCWTGHKTNLEVLGWQQSAVESTIDVSEALRINTVDTDVSQVKTTIELLDTDTLHYSIHPSMYIWLLGSCSEFLVQNQANTECYMTTATPLDGSRFETFIHSSCFNKTRDNLLLSIQ